MLSLKKFDSKKLHLIGLGCDFHYRIFQTNIDKYKNDKSFWAYDKAKVDIAYFLANQTQKINILTYITSEKFQTIEIKEKSQSERIPQKDKVLDFIHNYNYFITDSYSEPHPFKAYALICRYMNAQAQKQLKSIFRLSFSEHPIKLKGSFIPKMDEIRKKHLKTQGLKLRILERKSDATSQEIEENISAWKKHFQIEQIIGKMLYTRNPQVENQKQNWVAENNFGWQVDLKMIKQGFGKKYDSFSFK